MRRRSDVARGCAFGVCLAAAACPLPGSAAAEAPAVPERVHISYSLGPDCPAPEIFERQLDAQLGTAWKAAPEELARNVNLVAASADGGASVRLEYQDRDGREIARSVEAKTCAEALAVMAVITAVAIDAQLREPAPSAPPASAESVAAPAPVESATPTVRTPAPVRAPEGSRDHASDASWTNELGARASLASGFGTRVAFGAGAEWAMVSSRGVALRAAAEGRDTFEVPAEDGRARFRALTLRAELCPVTVVLGAPLGVPLCAGLEGGALWAEGVITPPAVTFATSSAAPWFALVASPRLRLATGRWFAELVPEVRIPLLGHQFLFQNPTRVAYEIPHLAFGLALAGGVRFR